MKRLLVIGGGLTGLSAAWHARRAGTVVRLLERSAQTGGVVSTYQENGYLVESGPNSLQLSSLAQLELLANLGLGEEIVPAAPWARNRFIVRHGKPRPLPLTPLQFIHSPLVNFRVALRLLRELRVPPRPPGADGEESIADFVRRRFGPDIFNYAFDPFVAGVYAGDPARLSARHALPRLFALEAEHGSVLRGLRAQSHANRGNAAAFTSRSVSFRSGMAALPRALTAQLGDAVTTSAQLTSLQRDPSGAWLASWQTPASAEQQTFDAVVLAVPAHAVGRLPLPQPLVETLAPLARVEHAPVAIVALGFPQSAVRGRLDGFGLLVPSVEPFDILGTLFTSSIFPDRAPTGHVLLTTFVGGARRPEFVAQPDATLIDLVAADLKILLRLRGTPAYQRVVRWDRAIPQYGLDHGRLLAALDAAESAWPGLALAGSYRGGVSVTQCLENGRLAAERILNLASVPAA
jgi:oxygen-dependent protoporphyrinogen oxidase